MAHFAEIASRHLPQRIRVLERIPHRVRGLLRRQLQRAVAGADVQLDGERPWDLKIHDARFYRRVAVAGSLGFGESYVAGWWDCDALDELVCRLVRARADEHFRGLWSAWDRARAGLVNLQGLRRAGEVGRFHYDLGNDLFAAMLGKYKIYSCGYWRDAGHLDAAQEAKLDLVCRKLHLAPGLRVLDIGCGWGDAARYAAEHYGVEVVGITISAEQAREARERCRGLPVEIRLCDYRAIEGRFDRVFSLGMFEHVGYKNYDRFMEVVRDRLSPDGLFLLHTIGGAYSVRSVDPWIGRYIFPNSMLPSATQISAALERRFVIEDWHNFGADYDATLTSWYRNFEAHWPVLARRYDERFRRTWRYYLLACAGTFRARSNQLWQLVLSPRGVRGGYHSVR